MTRLFGKKVTKHCSHWCTASCRQKSHWLSAAWAIWQIRKRNFYFYLTPFLKGCGAWLETRDRNEEGNDTLSHVTLWAHETFSVKYNCKQDGSESQILALASFVCLNCEYFGWRGAKSSNGFVCLSVAFGGCTFCLVEVGSRQKPYQHDTWSMCARVRMIVYVCS